MKLRPIVVLACAWLLTEHAPGADTQAPWVLITSPSSGTTVSSTALISVTATDNVAAASVRLKVDGADIRAPLTNPPFIFSLDTRKLANGMHSLLAVATDAAGNFARSAIVSITASNPPTYTLGNTPFAIEALGSPLSANTFERPTYYQLSNETHLILYYLADYGTHPLQICDVNLAQGTARLTNGVLGRPGTYGTVHYPTNNLIYHGTGEASGTGYFMEYNPVTGQTRQIAQISGITTYFCELGDDGWIYIGQYGDAEVDRYNPGTDAYQRLGKFDTGSSSYAYTLGADSRYLYIGTGQDPWILAIYDTQTSNTVYHWQYDNDQLGLVRHGTNGRWYYYRRDASSVIRWYQLTNGAPVLLGGQPSGLMPQYQRGNVVDGVANTSFYGWEADLAYAYPNSFSNAATIQWRTLGAETWESVTVTNFHLHEVELQRLYSWPYSSGKLLGFSAFYQPVFLWDVDSRQTTVLGLPQFNPYDAAFDGADAYFSCYSTATLRYDPTEPWTLTASTANKFDTNINPHQISLAIGKHNFFVNLGSDGLVYVGVRHERNASGGELGWYDPITGTNGSLRAPFLEHDINDLKPALGASKMVYASTTSNLFVFDVATKSLTLTNAPLGSNGLDKIIEVAPGMIFGAAGSNIFKFDITTGSLVYSNQLPGKAFAESIAPYNRRLVLGPDGYVWMFRWYRDAQYFNRSSLYRINPADASYSIILTNTFYSYGEKNLMFNGGDLYLYGGPNLHRVQRMLATAMMPPSGLKIVAQAP